MRTLVFTFIFILFCHIGAIAGSPNETLLQTLDQELSKREQYFSQRQSKIDSLKKIAASIPDGDAAALSKAYHDIFTGYSSFQGDSALHYALMAAIEARKTGSSDNILRAHTDIIFAHMSSGNFTDAVTVINNTDVSQASTPFKIRYYLTLMRLYADLADYANNQFSDSYLKNAVAFSDSVRKMASPDSVEYLLAAAFPDGRNLSPGERIRVLKQLLANPAIESDDKAMISSLIADAFREIGVSDSLIHYKVQAAILDTKAAKRETIATLDLGKIFADRGDIERAYRYLKFAIEDADFYNMRSRKMHILAVQTEIDEKHNDLLSAKRRKLWLTIIGFLLLTAILASAIVLIVRKLRHIRHKREESEKKRLELQLENAGHQQKIADLTESNNMKDEYIGYGISAQVEYIRKLEELYNTVDKRLMLKQYDELHKSLKYGDIHKNRDAMNTEFDNRFLKLFPDFIEQWKTLFPADDIKNAESDGTTLTNEMRIFALMKVGVTEVKDIATFLGYSVNTVNTYKTKAKKRSIVPKDVFEQRVMEIGRKNAPSP